MIRVGFAGWAGVSLPDGAELALPNDLGWLYRMGRGGFAGWADLALPDGPGWLC